MAAPIYLDYAATTPVAPEVAEVMAKHLTLDGVFANPASRSHLFGWQAEEAVENARGQVADLLGADPREIVFTSGATESDNLALKGAALARSHKGRHIVSSLIEHKAVLDSLRHLETQGFEVTYLQPDATGTVTLANLADALRPDTVLVSLMHVNNELGAVNDIGALSRLCRERGIAFHSDAAQSAGRLRMDLRAMDIDLLSVSAHKMYGPKGVGALYVRRAPDNALEAQIHGGGHERGMRSGTLATHQIVGFGAAAALARVKMAEDEAYTRTLAALFWRGIRTIPGAKINGPAVLEAGMPDDPSRVPGILNVCFPGVDGEQLLFALGGVAVSTGSACTSASVEPSYVLKGIGLSDSEAHGSLRFSFGRYTSIAEVELAAAQTVAAVTSMPRNTSQFR